MGKRGDQGTTRFRPSWAPIVLSIVLIAVLQLWVTSGRALTDFESTLSALTILILGIWAGKKSSEEAAFRQLEPLARSALRRVVTLYGALVRLRRHISNYLPTFAPDIEEESMGVLLAYEEARHSLTTLRAVVDEQIVTAKDAIRDWSEILPGDSKEILDQISLEKESMNLQRKLQQARLDYGALDRQGKEDKARAEDAVAKIDELAKQLEAKEKELEAVQARSHIAIGSETPLAIQKKASVHLPEGFKPISVPQTIGLTKLTSPLYGLDCKSCGNSRITSAILAPGGGACASCGAWACGLHLTEETGEVPGPLCIECFAASHSRPS